LGTKKQGKFLRGWLPNEHTSYVIKRTAIAHKWLATYLALVFIVGIILRLFVMPLFWPAAGEITDRAIAMFTMFTIMLVALYYLKTQGSPKQIRTIFALGIALPVGFALFVVAAIVIKAVTGNSVQGFDALLIFTFGYTVGFIIGIPTSKKVQARYSRGAFGAMETGRTL
jgi:hypothetical protein